MATLQAYLIGKLQAAGIPETQIGRVLWFDEVVRGWRVVPLAQFASVASKVQVAAIPEDRRTRVQIVVNTPEGDKIVQYNGTDFFIDDGENFREPFTASHLTTP